MSSTQVPEASQRRILYVPGIRAKPPPAIHTPLLRRCVVEGVRRADAGVAAELEAAPATVRPVLWGHLLYPDYRDPKLDETGIAALLTDPAPGRASIPEIFGWRRRTDYLVHRLGDRFPGLIDWLADEDTRITLADTQRYFRNAGGAADRIRDLLRAELRQAWAAGERVLLMTHSFGSVIAWDTLWQLREESGPIDLFLTLGSPLGTRYIRHRLLGAREAGAARYPRNIHNWHNLAALGGLTALGHRFGDDFAEMRALGLVGDITDRTDLVNPFRSAEGLNVHKCYGYFVNAATGAEIARWWRADDPAASAG